MISDQLRRQSLSLAANLELHQQALAYVAGAATHRLESHYDRSRPFDRLFRPSTLRRDLLVSRFQSAIFIEISDHALGRVANLIVRTIHVKLPFQVFG